MVLKRVMKSSPPGYLASKMKKSRTEQNASESLAVALKSLPHSMPHRFDQPDHSATPVGTSHRHATTISPAARSTNGHNSASSASASHGEIPKLMIKLKPVLPKVTQSGFPFIFANSDSDNSEPVKSPVFIACAGLAFLKFLIFNLKGSQSKSFS